MTDERLSLHYTVDRDDLMSWMRWVINRRPQIRKARRYISPLFAAIVVLITLMQFPNWAAATAAALVGSLVGWLVLPRLLDNALERQLRSSADGVADGVLGSHTLYLRGTELTHATSAAETVTRATNLREIVVHEGRAFLMLGSEQGIVVPLDGGGSEAAEFIAAVEAARR